jgi:hypothetical protein
MSANSIADEISPMFVGARAIALSLTNPLVPAMAKSPVGVSVSYTQAEPAGVKLPLELIITGPSPSSFRRRYFRKLLPSSFDFIPAEGGGHQLLLREIGHNRWLGTLTVSVSGEVFEG